MSEGTDNFKNVISLSMETYKALNRELTIKNQELRQYGTALREELCDLRRRLMEERASRASLKKAVISVITESFNQIICLLYENDVDKQLMASDFASGDSTQKEMSEDARNNQRSSYMARASKGHNSTPPRKSFVDSSIAIRSPLVEVQKNNVTVRNRRPKQPEELNDNTENPGEGVDVLERAELNNSPEENETSISYAMPLPVVIEETSSKMDMSSIINQRSLTVVQLELANSENTLMPEKSSQSRVVGSGDSRSELEQPLSSLTVPDIHFNETSFNNSSMLKAPSSTPYKKTKNNESDETSIRSLRVLIPRLKESSLSHYGITQSTIEDTHSPQSDISSPKPSTSKARKRNLVKNISSQVENESQSSKSSPRRRPKRKAAEAAKSNLVEPLLSVKMRRKT